MAPSCDDERLTYKQFIALASEIFGRDATYKVLGKWTLTALGLVSRQVRELRELLPRYEHDNLFDSSKYKQRFPDFKVDLSPRADSNPGRVWPPLSRTRLHRGCHIPRFWEDFIPVAGLLDGRLVAQEALYQRARLPLLLCGNRRLSRC